MGIGITELLIILLIVALLFGTKKLRSAGGDLGAAISSFRQAMTEPEPAGEPAQTAEASPTPTVETPPPAETAPAQAAEAPQAEEAPTAPATSVSEEKPDAASNRAKGNNKPKQRPRK